MTKLDEDDLSRDGEGGRPAMTLATAGLLSIAGLSVCLTGLAAGPAIPIVGLALFLGVSVLLVVAGSRAADGVSDPEAPVPGERLCTGCCEPVDLRETTCRHCGRVVSSSQAFPFA